MQKYDTQKNLSNNLMNLANNIKIKQKEMDNESNNQSGVNSPNASMMPEGSPVGNFFQRQGTKSFTFRLAKTTSINYG